MEEFYQLLGISQIRAVPFLLNLLFAITLKALDCNVCQFPEEWFWLHDRWKRSAWE